MRYETAKSKAVATARMYLLGGATPEPLGPGSKEKRSSLEYLARFLGIDVTGLPGKTECGRVIAEHLEVTWDQSCYSRGDTITLIGLNRLVDATVMRYLIPLPDELADDLLGSVIDAAKPTLPTHARQTTRKEGSPVTQDYSELEQNIAEYIAGLSEPGQLPSDIPGAPDVIYPDAVRFDDGSWRQRLLDVQGWLYLPVPLDSSSPGAFEESLTSALWPDSQAESDLAALLPRLEERLDKATALRERFIQLMDAAGEGSETLESATQAWIDAWDQATQEDEAEESGPIHAEADTWPIVQFVQYAEDDELNLSPSYQRADVWPTSDAQLLIESILRGIPLPSVIILEREDGGRATYEVVDGKQRLTSILRFMGRHPRALALVEAKKERWNEPGLVRIFREEYPTFKKLWNKNEQTRLTAQIERTNYFPFPLRSGDVKPLSGNLENLRGKYYSEIRQETIQVQNAPRNVRYVFEQQSSYKIPVITYKQVSAAQVHEVFSLYNKQGKHLNAEEIRNALYHELDLMRALLVTAGDSDNVGDVAPFLLDAWEDLSSTSRALDSYGFGRVGYKRTKILSWVAAALLLDDGRPESRSTASHVNSLLKRVAANRNDPLRSVGRVKAAMMLLDHGIDAHAVADEGWFPSFKNAQNKNKWQELQLVASIIGMSAASAVLADDLEEVAEAAIPDLQAVSATWRRPGKTQSREQWLFIAKVVEDLLRVLGVDPNDADSALRERFGESGLASLLGRT